VNVELGWCGLHAERLDNSSLGACGKSIKGLIYDNGPEVKLRECIALSLYILMLRVREVENSLALAQDEYCTSDDVVDDDESAIMIITQA
jgi:hypothetical protein